MDEKLSTAKFTFAFEGTHEISASHLAASLNALNTLVLETQETCYPDTSCNLKVVANREGSFEIDLSVLALTAISMFTSENINYALSITKLILQFFDIKKHIKDSLPKVKKETDKTIVENKAGDVKEYSGEAYSFFKNAKIENAIVQIIEAGDTSRDVTGIKVTANGGERITIDGTEFRSLKTPVVGDINVPTQTIASTDTFYVKQATFIGDAQWVFVKERPFHAKILDTIWLAEYAKAKHPIVPGIRIRADMLTVLQIGENGLPIEGRATHEIIKVHEVFYPEEFQQIEL
jgi:hypothetical protein